MSKKIYLETTVLTQMKTLMNTFPSCYLWKQTKLPPPPSIYLFVCLFKHLVYIYVSRRFCVYSFGIDLLFLIQCMGLLCCFLFGWLCFFNFLFLFGFIQKSQFQEMFHMFLMCADDSTWDNHYQSYKVQIEQKTLNNQEWKSHKVHSTE